MVNIHQDMVKVYVDMVIVSHEIVKVSMDTEMSPGHVKSICGNVKCHREYGKLICVHGKCLGTCYKSSWTWNMYHMAC
jgi:hypothetical protein